jgi:hypothetical protein
MDLKSLSSNRWLYRVLLIVCVSNAAIIWFLLSKIDGIINIELYKFGLQFSNNWANSYWTYLDLSYVILGISVALSLFVLVLVESSD